MIRLKYPVILASSSPRRAELLRTIINDFKVEPAHLDEESLTVDDPWQTAQTLAREKAFAIFESHPEYLVISGDTVVALKSSEDSYRQFAKPANQEDAVAMLSALSGKTHSVITGVCLRWPKGMKLFTEASHVTFRDLHPREIQEYVATNEPMDKAGAYAIQGGAAKFVERVEGSMTNVIGFPIERIEEELMRL